MATKTAKTAKATPEEAQKLDSLVADFLQKNEAKKAMEKEIEALKESINAQITYEKRTFEDGQIKLSTGLIKEVASAPSLVFAGTGKALTPAQREKLASSFPEAYRKLDLDTKLIAEVWQKNQDVANALGQGNVQIKEGTSIQVKPL